VDPETVVITLENKMAAPEPAWSGELYALMVGFTPEKAGIICNLIKGLAPEPIKVEVCTFLVACITVRRNEIVTILGKLSDAAKSFIRDNFKLSSGDLNFTGMNLTGWLILATDGPALKKFKDAVVYKTGATSFKLASFSNSSDRYKAIAIKRRDNVNTEAWNSTVTKVKWTA
jgi:hypothetical protein